MTPWPARAAVHKGHKKRLPWPGPLFSLGQPGRNQLEKRKVNSPAAQEARASLWAHRTTDPGIAIEEEEPYLGASVSFQGHRRAPCPFRNQDKQEKQPAVIATAQEKQPAVIEGANTTP
ncbi:hypothetical protein NDU88_001702 [Pleurodeles waltl]|uniref:Uncharacterized protein n=1 Tax=Pleurodeles waltl TaxID=8319 RepID=A0AAV7V936_PLEWA|nr:hypothetical protein NDU88_001702 [Pleurodeles waltl]